MRKFLFFLLLIPAIAALGHDIYIYQQEPEKGFRLSDAGALWDKYHKESHDQWKTKVKEFTETVEEIVPESDIAEDIIPEGLIPEGFFHEEKAIEPVIYDQASSENEEEEKIAEEPEPTVADFSEGFTQSIERDGTTKVTTLSTEDYEEAEDKNVSSIIFAIGFLLEQKAVFILGAIPVFFLVISLVLSLLFKEKEEMDKVRTLKKKKRKGGGYTYSRK